mmetsp:Transcript_36717/g.79957  ORF Transcript_36717/g.79957 Transcript_36717/m.79957 type:complete len:101 (-) Transcript_36717:96-398(-)
MLKTLHKKSLQHTNTNKNNKNNKSLSEQEKENKGEVLIYVGDGSNDYCVYKKGCTVYKQVFILARKGLSLEKLILKNQQDKIDVPHNTECFSWKDEFELV